jgi:ABC-type transporter Mla MlaB component
MSDAVSLPAELTIYTIGELGPRWLQWLGDVLPTLAGAPAAGEVFRLGAEEVAEVDAAGIQLLVSFSRSLARQHRNLQLVRPSAVLSGACAALGASVLMARAELASTSP